MSNKRAVEIKSELVQYKGGKCKDCGFIFPDCCMDFDHRDPLLKNFKLSDSKVRPLEELKLEADKCDLVCSNCHRIRTAGNKAIALKLSEAAKGNVRAKGRPRREVSTETRVKLSLAHKGKPRSPETIAKIKATKALKRKAS